MIFGIGLLLLSLILDGVTASFQDSLRDKFLPSTHQHMLYNNLWAVALLLVACIFTGQLWTGFSFSLSASSSSSSTPFWGQLLIFSLSSAFGQNFIFFTIRHFNALVLTTITTTRKFFTILFSVFIYGHVLNYKQWSGVSLVMIGLAIEAEYKYRKKQEAKLKKLQEEESKSH